MTFKILDNIWHPDTDGNADWFHTSPGTVLLLDGAAALDNEHVSSLENDAVWFVRRFVEHFSADATSGVGPRAMAARIERARMRLRQEYDELCKGAELLPRETPFSCLTIVQDAGVNIDFYNMGDLTTLIRGLDGSVRRFGESAVRELDRQALEHLKREIAEGVEPHSARLAKVWPCILENRALRNVMAGYDVLDVNASTVEHLELLSCQRGEVRDILMMSDGFYRLVDTYSRYTDTSLFAEVESRGLHDLLRELRSIELEDGHCKEYPRFKQQDDATALWLATSEAS